MKTLFIHLVVLVFSIGICQSQDILFMDDFSYPGPRPNQNWEDQNVLINNTFSGNIETLQAPSLGVATFDGLDDEWLPYDNDQVDGLCDVLTSIPIDLSVVPNQENIYLSFYLQPKGIGNPPNYCDNASNCDEDRVVVSFKKTNSDEWVEFSTINGMSEDDFPGGIPDTEYIPPFEFYTIEITGSEYRTADFQFKFEAFGNVGIYDIWNLDYVLITKGSEPNPQDNFEDIAFTQLPPNLLERYSIMPWKHFYGNESTELTSTINTAFYSHFDFINAVDNPVFNIIDQSTNNTLMLEEYLIGNTDQNIDPNTYEVFPNIPFNTGNLASIMNGFYNSNEDKVTLELEYNFSVNEESDTPEDIVRNNNCSSLTKFDSYFAYDDGSAELLDELDHWDKAAIQCHTNVEDRIYGVQFHFINDKINPPEDEKFDIFLYTDGLDSDPTLTMYGEKPKYYAKNNGFATYIFKDEFTKEPTPILIPADADFYVGCSPHEWTDLRIGVDRNSPESTQYQFRNGSNDWEQTVAYMIRPIMGDEFMERLPSELSLVDPPPGTTLSSICEDEEFTYLIDIGNPLIGTDCEGDPIYINIDRTDFGNVGREPNLYPNVDNVYQFTSQYTFFEPGTYTFDVYIESNCGGSYQTFTFTVLESEAIPPTLSVCNDATTANNIRYITSGEYKSVDLRSAGNFCNDLPKATLVKNQTNVFFIAADQIILYDGFKAEIESQFLAKIGIENCYHIDDSRVRGEDPPRAAKQIITEEIIATNDVSVFPNPFDQEFTIEIMVNEQEAMVSAQLFQVNGAKVSDIINQVPFGAGEHLINFDGSNLPTGMYLCKIMIGNQSFVRKLIKTDRY